MERFYTMGDKSHIGYGIHIQSWALARQLSQHCDTMF